MKSLLKRPQRLYLALSCVLCTLTTTAQTVSTTYQNAINSTFSGIDKSKVPHALLIDYAMEFTELSAYNGTLYSDNLTHRGHYTAIYNTLLMARVQSVPSLVGPTSFRTNWENLRQPNKIVLSGLYYKYSRLREDAYPNKITVTNNKLYDKYINGVWQNPYEDQEVFAVASPILKFNKLNVDVELPASLWYTNQSSSVHSIAIDFGDGNGYQTMTFGQAVSISYPQAGMYEWTYKLTLINNDVLYSHSKLIVEGTAASPPLLFAKRDPTEPCPTESCAVDPTTGIHQVEFCGTRTYLGQANKAILEIDYSGADCIIDKPLIVVEGFDSGLLGVENELGEERYLTFNTEARDNTGGLPAELNTYDIIYINWEDSQDYLQRNTALLKDIIEWVNSEKTSNTPNVILGQSMGGLIARAALVEMENTSGEDHDTSLYISHDAPHRGANIPLSIQYFARHMIDQFVRTPLGDVDINVTGNGGPLTIEDLQSVLDAPGTQQLLSQRITSGFALSTTVHDTWQSQIAGQYPQQTRNIAISNGNHCANTQTISPFQDLFSLNGSGRTSFLTDYLSQLLKPLTSIGYIYLAIAFNEPGLLIGILPGKSKFNMDFKARALPVVGSGSQIYKGEITFIKTIKFLFLSFDILVNITDRSYNSPANAPSIDHYPGGFQRSFLDGSNIASSGLFGSFNITATAADRFNFIPTASALDIGGELNIPLDEYSYLYRYNINNPLGFPFDPPFDNYTSSFPDSGNQNEPHISFNTRNGNWLATELDNDPSNNQIFDCEYTCTPANIWGSSTICSSNTYSLSQVSSSYNWTVNQSGSIVTVTGNGTPNPILTRNGNSSGLITISITPTGDCGPAPATATKEVWVGKPVPEVSGSVPNLDLNPVIAQNDDVTIYIQDIGDFLNLNPSNFEVTNFYGDFTFHGVFGDVLYMTCNTAQPYLNLSFDARVKNNCGWGPWRTFTYFLQGYCSGCSGWSFMVLSNTTSPEIEVVINENNSSISSAPGSTISKSLNAKNTNAHNVQAETFSVSIANIYGSTIYEKTNILDRTIKVDKTSWQKGIYFMKITDSKGVSQSKGFIVN